MHMIMVTIFEPFNYLLRPLLDFLIFPDIFSSTLYFFNYVNYKDYNILFQQLQRGVIFGFIPSRCTKVTQLKMVKSFQVCIHRKRTVVALYHHHTASLLFKLNWQFLNHILAQNAHHGYQGKKKNQDICVRIISSWAHNMVSTKFSVSRFIVELQKREGTTVVHVMHQRELSMRRIPKHTKTKDLCIFSWSLNRLKNYFSSFAASAFETFYLQNRRCTPVAFSIANIPCILQPWATESLSP